jgi:hypothetical protein
MGSIVPLLSIPSYSAIDPEQMWEVRDVKCDVW